MKLKNNKGITLIELMIALAIASIIIGVIGTFFIANYKMFFHADDQIKIQTEARNAMKEIVYIVIETKGVSNFKEVKDDSGIYDIFEFTKETNNKVVIRFNKTTVEKEKQGKLFYSDMENSITDKEVASNIISFKILPIPATDNIKTCKGIKIQIRAQKESNNGNSTIDLEDSIYFRNNQIEKPEK